MSMKDSTVVQQILEEVTSSPAQHSMASEAEKEKHAAEMKKKFGVETKYKGDDELTYSGSKGAVKKAIISHYYGDTADAAEQHPELFEATTVKPDAEAKSDTNDTDDKELSEGNGCDDEEDDDESEDGVKVDVSEDVAALVHGEELSEEFKTKAATIFEAAVVGRVRAEVQRIQEEHDARLTEQVEQVKTSLVEKVDSYLDYVVEQWLRENELAVENGVKNEIMESFITGMKGLFERHYIEVPEERANILEELTTQVTEARSALNEQLEVNVELKKSLNEMKRTAIIGEFTRDMPAASAEKFAGLCEELAFDNTVSFKQKLKTIRENYFSKKTPVLAESVVYTTAPIISAGAPVETLTESVGSVDPAMARYLRAFNGVK